VPQLASGTEDQLGQEIADMEQEISLLHSQQRDIRFLGKRLNAEIQIRLNNRAKLYTSQRSLIYQPDSMIDQALDSDKNNTSEILKLVHQRDGENIKITNTLISSYFRVMFWRLSSKSYSAIIKVARKVARI
jgi:hypothetical protein